VKGVSLRKASLATLLVACGAKTGILGDTEESLVPDATVGVSADAAPPPKDAGHEAPFDAPPPPVSDAGVRILTHDDQGFYEVHAPEGTIQTVGPGPDTPLTDIALSPDKKTLYGAASGGRLTIIDRSTWRTTETHDTPVEKLNALEVGPDGTIYGAGWDTVYTLLRDGTTTVLARFPDGLHSSGDLAFVGPRLFATVNNAANEALVEVDLATKTTRLIGTTNASCIYGIVGADSLLYGVTCYRSLVQIDITTAETKELTGALTDNDPGFLGATRL
jgi:hypothetical protein